MMEIKEVRLTDRIARELIALSADWEAESVTLGTATKNFRSILHFCIGELGV